MARGVFVTNSTVWNYHGAVRNVPMPLPYGLAHMWCETHQEGVFVATKKTPEQRTQANDLTALAITPEV